MKMWGNKNKQRILLHACWRVMRYRCTHKNHKQFPDYGGRGIKVCNEWLYDYKSFELWARKNGYKKGMTIDRENNDGNYEPSNCRWVTQKVNNQNRRNTVRIKYKGEIYLIEEAALKFNIPKEILSDRITRNWTPKEAIETRFFRLNKPITWNGKTQTMKEWSEELGISYNKLKSRLGRQGWPIERSLTEGVE